MADINHHLDQTFIDIFLSEDEQHAELDAIAEHNDTLTDKYLLEQDYKG